MKPAQSTPGTFYMRERSVIEEEARSFHNRERIVPHFVGLLTRASELRTKCAHAASTTHQFRIRKARGYSRS